jgi:myosin heavy subunit
MGNDQSILVSGESGSGKTEATKLMMSHLASISGAEGGERGEQTIERVLEANPLLECVHTYTDRDHD